MLKDFLQEKTFVFSAMVIHFKNCEGACSCKSDYPLALPEKVCLFLLKHWEQGA
jgi:hypothetical protein